MLPAASYAVAASPNHPTGRNTALEAAESGKRCRKRLNPQTSRRISMDPKPYEPYVPADTTMKEFTLRAVLLGVVMAVVLGAANAYIGMVAGLTIAATFPAAVVAMALLKPDHRLGW
jgi:hypothetical protein